MRAKRMIAFPGQLTLDPQESIYRRFNQRPGYIPVGARHAREKDDRIPGSINA